MPSVMPLRMLRTALLLGAVLLVGLLFGCRTDGEDAEPAAPADPTSATEVPTAGTPSSPSSPQVLFLNLTSEPATIDPQRATDQVSLTLVRNLHAGLLRLDPGDELVPDLASEVPTVENGGISADGLTYTFRLREGLRWS
ncbi:MAG: hypothetical protein WD942_11815, partial [Dehalococcoidia bacterium]